MNDVYSVLKLGQIMKLLKKQDVIYKLVSCEPNKNHRTILTYMAICNELFGKYLFTHNNNVNFIYPC